MSQQLLFALEKRISELEQRLHQVDTQPRAELKQLQDDVEALQSKHRGLHSQVQALAKNVTFKEPNFDDMSDEQLREETCKVISGVLDHWEGDDTGLRNYGEIRAKNLLVALRERGE